MTLIRNLHVAVAACSFLTLTAFAVDAAPKQVKMDGWISETKCGADHAGAGADPGCVAKCIKEGAKPVFVDDAKKAVWMIDNPDAIKAHYGHHVEFTGTEDVAKMQVHIDKVSMLADQGKASGSSEHK